MATDRLYLIRMRQNAKETFRHYALRWKNQTSQVDPPLADSEYVHLFVQTCKGIYYEKLCTSIGRSFHEIILQGELIEDGVKTGKILDPYARSEEGISSQARKPPPKKSKKPEVSMIMPSPRPNKSFPFQQGYPGYPQ